MLPNALLPACDRAALLERATKRRYKRWLPSLPSLQLHVSSRELPGRSGERVCRCRQERQANRLSARAQSCSEERFSVRQLRSPNRLPWPREDVKWRALV